MEKIMILNKILSMIMLLSLISCAAIENNKINNNSRDIASSVVLNDAISRVKKQCKIGKRAIKKMVKNAKKPTYLKGEGQKLQTFVLDNGKVVVIDLNNCSNVKTFTFRGDKVVDSRQASGQIYFRSSKGKIYVLIPKPENTYESSFTIFEIGTTNNTKFSKRVFYSLKRTNKGEQGILAWSTLGCSQEEVGKSPKARLKECSDKNATLEIRGKAIDSGRRLYRVNQYSKRPSKPADKPVKPDTVKPTSKPQYISSVYFIPVQNKPKQCVTVSLEVMFLYIFSIEEVITYCE
jgi:hypothetical protein